MLEATIPQIRHFRLHSHHLDAPHPLSSLHQLAGACGFQNSPPGAWETAAFCRIPSCSLEQLEHFLYTERSLLQAWSIRGIPLIFPTRDADVFLSALCAREGEPWIYNQGIQLALDALSLKWEQVWEVMKRILPRLKGITLASKTDLDETLASWMRPLLPPESQEIWCRPSMYGHPDRQTVGGAVVSFLLRPASLEGTVVFGKREGIQPTFTAFLSWVGHSLSPRSEAERELVRRYLHCYGPATKQMFGDWSGCSPAQASRLWKQMESEMEPVLAAGKKMFLLRDDCKSLLAPPKFSRNLLFVGSHDPFLDQRDRYIIQANPRLQRKLWQTVSNPGAVLFQGEAVGMWQPRKKGKKLDIVVTLWKELSRDPELQEWGQTYAAFRKLELGNLTVRQESAE